MSSSSVRERRPRTPRRTCACKTALSRCKLAHGGRRGSGGSGLARRVRSLRAACQKTSAFRIVLKLGENVLAPRVCRAVPGSSCSGRPGNNNTTTTQSHHVCPYTVAPRVCTAWCVQDFCRARGSADAGISSRRFESPAPQRGTSTSARTSSPRALAVRSLCRHCLQALADRRGRHQEDAWAACRELLRSRLPRTNARGRGTAVAAAPGRRVRGLATRCSAGQLGGGRLWGSSTALQHVQA